MLAPNFDDIKVSTKTIIAVSNLNINIKNIFHYFPLDGNKDQEINIQTIYYGSERRGAPINKKKSSFRNAINMIAIIDNSKKVNFKISKNGKFQLTGCKSDDNAIKIIIFFVKQLMLHCSKDVSIANSDKITVYFQCVMTNIDFSIGYSINRQKLDEMLNESIKYHSLLETSCGYTGVNVKSRLDMKWWDIEIPVISCWVDDLLDWKFEKKSLSSLVDVTTEMKNKKKYNTFLVFHSGNIIMSGIMKETMKKDFDVFNDLLIKWKDQIIEKIDEN
jgi:TATA-box binding protein (TBP) (component of TFIID and TFIIIB)